MKIRSIDINADLGEGAGRDEDLMPLVTSANIACGGHAGDRSTLRGTMNLAQRLGVAVGAHPGFMDRAHFGRLELPVTPEAAAALVLDQIGVAQDVAREAGIRVRHVKLHGALYNLAARSREHADAIAAAVRSVDPDLIFIGLAGSHLLAAGRALGLKVASEVFADRSYRSDGFLTPRSHPEALLRDDESAIAQALGMICEGKVRSIEGVEIPVVADTLCLHGDTPGALQLARRLHSALRMAGIKVRAFAG